MQPAHLTLLFFDGYGPSSVCSLESVEGHVYQTQLSATKVTVGGVGGIRIPLHVNFPLWAMVHHYQMRLINGMQPVSSFQQGAIQISTVTESDIKRLEKNNTFCQFILSTTRGRQYSKDGNHKLVVLNWWNLSTHIFSLL